MLNELKVLSDSIQAAGIYGEEWDDSFKPILVKGFPCFVVSLSEEGEIVDVRFLEPERAKVLRTWQGGSNGECFPSFKLLPYYELQEDKGASLSSSQKSTALKEFVAKFLSSEEFPSAVGPIVLSERGDADRQTAKCLGTIANSFFEKILADECDTHDSFIRLRTAVSKLIAGSNANSFNRKMLVYLRHHLSENAISQKDASTIWSILFKKTSKVVLYFELADHDSCPIASEESMRTINDRLLAVRPRAEFVPKDAHKDAFGNLVSVAELSGKFPEVKLPGVLANTRLRSMSGDSRCQARYGRVDAASFPVGDEVRKAAKSALAWIASPEREGRTWAVAGANELVFAYPKSMPKAPPLLARLFGNGRSLTGDDATEARFVEYAEAALSGIKTLSQRTSPNTEIKVFAIKKADKARRKVVFYRNYSLEMLGNAIDEWLVATRNIPDIRLLRWPRLAKGEKVKKGTKPVLAEFGPPLPLAAVRLVYEVWSQDGNEKVEPKFRSAPLYDSIPVFDGLELFLGNPATTGLAQRMLSLLLQHSTGLCVAVGNISHRQTDDVIANSRVATHLETALPLFGILLQKLNYKKEIYMENAPYLIGRFLNLADGLHGIWCRNVKEKDPLPPQLLGSSLFASFQINPAQAFASASLRMKPYWDWAKTNRTQDAALARWFVGEFGRVSAAIAKNGIPSRLSDTDKAEMLLGYLASCGKSDPGEPESSDSTNVASAND